MGMFKRIIEWFSSINQNDLINRLDHHKINKIILNLKTIKFTQLIIETTWKIGNLITILINFNKLNS